MPLEYGAAITSGAQSVVEQLLKRKALEQELEMAARKQMEEERANRAREELSGRSVDISGRHASVAEGGLDIDRARQDFERQKWGDTEATRAADLAKTQAETRGTEADTSFRGLQTNKLQFDFDQLKDALGRLRGDPTMSRATDMTQAGITTGAVDPFDPEGATAHARRLQEINTQGANAANIARIGAASRGQGFVGRVDARDEQGRPIKVGIRRDGSTEVIDMPEGVTATGQFGITKELTDINTASTLIDRVEALGSQLDWAGVGGAGVGTMQQFLDKHAAVGRPESVRLRADIQNLQGIIRQVRSGQAVSANEAALLEGYAPLITDSPMVTQQKLLGLKQFLKDKRQGLISGGAVAQDAADAPSTTPPVDASTQTVEIVWERDPRTGRPRPRSR